MSRDYNANVKDAEKVKNCVRAGIVDVDRISKLLQISKRDLERCYPFELELTNDEDLAVVANVAFEMAACGKFPHMTQWYLRQKGGSIWQEPQQVTQQATAPIVIVMKPE